MNKLFKFRISPKGVLCGIYSNQKTQLRRTDRGGRRKHEINYSRQDIYQKFLNDKKFLILHRKWIKKGLKKDDKPSIDRVNPKIDYILSNIQIITWKQNNIKGKKENRTSKKVIMYDMNNKEIRRFSSATEAIKLMKFKGHHIGDVSSGKLKHYKNYKFKFI